MSPRKLSGQTEIPLPGSIGFKHDPDERYAEQFGREKLEIQQAAYEAERACTCNSPAPNLWGRRGQHKRGCPRAGKRF